MAEARGLDMDSYTTLFRHLERYMSDFAVYTQPRQLWDNPVLDLVLCKGTWDAKL